MKILFAIQATGNGHISRAKEIYPELQKYGEVDTLLSGVQSDVDPGFPVKYQLYGLSFIFGQKGGVCIWQTCKSLRIIRLIRDIIRLDIRQYDVVISDYEPISVWTGIFKMKKVYGLSHQAAVIHSKAAKPLFENDPFGRFILHNYAVCKENVGFYTQTLDKHIFPAVIRSAIRHLKPTLGDKIVVYLPSYSDAHLLDIFANFPEEQWLVFSKHCSSAYQNENVQIQKINDSGFVNALAAAKAVLIGAGFEGPCEALYLRKKVMVIPMKGQYEQQCNAAAFVNIGVPAIKELHLNYRSHIQQWLDTDQNISVDFPADTASKAVRLLMQIAGWEKLTLAHA